jgi:predicted metalloprotease with PDZ domain
MEAVDCFMAGIRLTSPADTRIARNLRITEAAFEEIKNHNPTGADDSTLGLIGVLRLAICRKYERLLIPLIGADSMGLILTQKFGKMCALSMAGFKCERGIFGMTIETLLKPERVPALVSISSVRMTVLKRASFLVLIPLLISSFAFSARAQCKFPPSQGGRAFTWSFTPEKTVSAAVLHATLQFQANSSGSEPIEVPVEWAGEKLHAISNVRALSEGTTIEDTPDPGSKIVHYPPNSAVTLAYDLSKDWQGSLRHPYQFHPVVMPEYFEINGQNSLVFPKTDRAARITANFDFHGLPNDWTLATSFGTPENHSEYCQSFVGPWEAVADAVFAAGDFRIRRFQIGRRAAVLAIRSQWIFTDDQAIAKIQQAVSIVRDFWHDDNFPYFLVTVAPYDQDRGSSDGSAFTNAFWMFLSRLDPLETQLPTLAHETFHAWDLRKMGPYDSYAKFNWFHEGFTQYYAYQLVYLAGLIPLSAYVESLNRDLRLYPGTDSPYIRGRGIAVWLDGEIRAESNGKKSLDNVMFDMVADSAKPITLERILATADRYLLPPAQRQLEAAANHGAVLVPAANAALPGCTALSVSVEQLPLFDLGFDLAASELSNRVVGVKQDGPAYAVGLRDGQKLMGVSVDNGQTDKLAKFTIDVSGEPKIIEYYPRGRIVSVPQYHLDQAALAAHPDSCLTR